tara:strand:+ start:1132 stop:1425 length:294 start_codon:yes stop_codon:yes gene_type:complete
MAKNETKEIKFTEEELKSLAELRDTYSAVQNDFGALRVQRTILEQNLQNNLEAEKQVEAKYVETQQAEQELVKTLNEKYGPGNLDPQTGVFTPIVSE